MEQRFMIKRFCSYVLLLIIPTVLGFLVSCVVLNSQMNRELDERARNTLQNVNVNLDFVISGVMFQNDQLTNNSYMVLAMKKLLRRDHDITYSDAIYQRNLRTMMSSILQSYPYIQSVYLYLDGYENFFSSEGGVTSLAECEDYNWHSYYAGMDHEAENVIISREISVNGRQRQMLTIYQPLLLLDGIVVMNIDVEKYRELLDQVLLKDDESILFYNRDNELILTWNPGLTEQGQEIVRSAGFPDRAREEKSNRWVRIDGMSYLLHEKTNSSYGLSLVSLISYEAKLRKVSQMLQMFIFIIIFEVMAVMALAYVSTKHSFKQLHYLVQLFSDAESGIYPAEPKSFNNEYDLIINNIIYLFLQTVKLNTSLTEKEHEQEVAELTALQLQINPHFLFNTLQNVQMEIKKLPGNTVEAVKILDHLSDILKYALADSQETISLREEIEYLKKYVAIQSYRFAERFIVYYEIDEQLSDIAVFRLMLQPLVENSILHGIRRRERKGYIKIQIFERQGLVHFRVVDNGMGMTGAQQESLRLSMETLNVHHIGLANVHRRLQLYYGDEAGIKIKSKPGWGCVMEFCLPVQRVKPARPQ